MVQQNPVIEPSVGTRPARADARVITFRDVDAPAIAYKDWELPAKATLEDYTDNFAVYDLASEMEHPNAYLGVLDLHTGRSSIFLKEAVNAADRWDMFSPRLSDQVIAWEEVTPGEGDDMGNAGWRLYAAKFDRASLRIGKPVKVAEGRTDTISRPFYGVYGTTVCWTRMSMAAARKQRRAPADSVESLDLATGKTRTVHASLHIIDGFKLSQGVAITTEMTGTPTADTVTPLTAVAVDAATGKVLRSAPLGNGYSLSHFADYADGWFFWTEIADGGGEPIAYIMDPQGHVSLAGYRSANPMISPRYAFCQSSAATGSPSAPRQVAQIRGVDLQARTRFILTATYPDTNGTWRHTIAGSRRNTLVLYSDPWLYDEHPEYQTSPVRVYRW